MDDEPLLGTHERQVALLAKRGCLPLVGLEYLVVRAHGPRSFLEIQLDSGVPAGSPSLTRLSLLILFSFADSKENRSFQGRCKTNRRAVDVPHPGRHHRVDRALAKRVCSPGTSPETHLPVRFGREGLPKPHGDQLHYQRGGERAVDSEAQGAG